MDKQQLTDFEYDVKAFATRYSVDRLKISTYNFDRDYVRGQDGRLHLKTQKAVIRVLGKVSKVAIGEGEQFSTYEEAFEATKKHWQEYYRKVRANRSDEQKQAEVKRQQRYRERRLAKADELKKRQ